MKINKMLMSSFLLLEFLTMFNHAEIASDDAIGNDEAMFAPSSLFTATRDNLLISAYLRTRTKEGSFPTNFQDTIDGSEKILSFRIRDWGLTFGWLGNGNNDLFSPQILALDYKVPFKLGQGNLGYAIDLKYSTQKEADSSLRRSLLNFGAISISGIAERELLWILNIYTGLTMNYIYVNLASEKLTAKWVTIPFIGVKVNVNPYYTTQLISEVSRVQSSKDEDALWNWLFGLSLGF